VIKTIGIVVVAPLAAKKDARHRQVGIGHFNVSDFVALKAVTETARELKTPVLIGTSKGERLRAQ
jgi:fructose/tagatose bisphosphate aldolase